MGKESLYNKLYCKNWTAIYKRLKLDYSLTPCTKINPKWIKDLNVRPEIITRLEENTGTKLLDISLSISDISFHARETKAKLNKWDNIKLKSFCTAKETIQKRPLTKWEKILTINTSDLGLISEIYKELVQLNIKKKKANMIKKWAEDLNRCFSKENIQMANKDMTTCSTSLIIRKMHIKTTVSYHFTPVRMAIIKKTINNKFWQACREK